jgi:hypothetical protein
VVETSPGSFQAWLRHAQPLSKELGTLAAKTLAEQFGADPSAADWIPLIGYIDKIAREKICYLSHGPGPLSKYTCKQIRFQDRGHGRVVAGPPLPFVHA